MRLAWHIAKKDLRRLALPAAGWLVLVVAPVLVLGFSSPAIDAHAPSQIDGWTRVYGIWLQLIGAMQWMIGYLLAGALVLEDPLVDTNSFWMTRPVANARLLGAKLLAAFVLLVAAPIAALLPIWLANGFGAADVARAAVENVARFGASALCAMMVASLARNLAQFLLLSVVIAGAALAVVFLPGQMAVRLSRHEVLLVAAVPVAVIVLVHQFLTRRVARSGVILAAAVAIAAAIPTATSARLGAASGPRAGAPKPGDRADDIVSAPAFTQHQANSVPSLYGRTTWRADGFVAPVYARGSDGAFLMRGAEMWARGAALRALGFQRTEERLHWQLARIAWSPHAREVHRLAGGLEAWAVRTRLLGEMPLRVGAGLRHDATQVRIIRLLSHEDRLHNIYLEERGPEADATRGWARNGSLRQAGRARHVDCYVLVGRTANEAQAALAAEIGQVATHSIVLRFLDVSVAWPDKLGEAVLVKVRFERDHAFEIPLEINGVSPRSFDQIP